MPISGQTVELLRKFTALVSCPSCGKRPEQVESLTSCGHYLCVNCVNTFVLNSDNKCPKCYASNRRNDLKEDSFVTSIFKITHKLNKLLDKQSSDQSKSKEQTKQSVTKSNAEPKRIKTKKELIIESLKSCIEMEAKAKEKDSISSINEPNKSKFVTKKSLDIEDDEDIISIPDSFDNESFTQRSKTGDNTELVSMIIEGLESANEGISFNETENGSGDQSKSMDASLMVCNKSPQKSQHFADIGVQTNEGFPRKVFQNASVQCIVSQSSNSAQTDNLVTHNTSGVRDQSSDCCQSNNCCFHKFIETIPCTSLKTFLKSLMELKASPSDIDQTLTNVPIVTETDSKSTVATTVVVKAPKSEEEPNYEEPLSSFAAVHSSSMDSIPSSHLSEQKTTDAKKQNKTKARQENGDKSKAKRDTSVQSKSKTKKMKTIETSDEEMEVNPTKSAPIESVSKPELPIVSIDVIQICSSVSSSKSNVGTEELTTKSKPRIKGPKSRQNTALKSNKEEVCEEPKTKPKASKVYISSDDEEEQEIDESETTKESNILTEERINKKSNRKTAPNKPQNKRRDDKSSVADSTSDDINAEEKLNKGQKKVGKRSTTKDLKKTSKKQKVEQLAEELAEKSNNENIFLFTDDEKSEQTDANESKLRTKRKAIPKKRFPIDDPKGEGKDSEVTINKLKKSSEIEDKPKDSDITEVKSTKYKPKPKSKQKQTISESDDDKFKRPKLWLSPTPSVALSEASTSSSSSRNRGSSTERSKRVILFSGLDEKQKKKIENVCRELDAEAVSDWSDKVTHLVIALADDRPKKDLICPRNAKYIRALLNNIWIVSYDWITDSSRSDRFLDENPYEIKADKTASERGLPTVSRTSRQKLFAKRMVKFEGKFGSLLAEFKDFVEIGGGVVIQSEEEFDNRKPKNKSEKLIIVTESVGLPNTQKDGTKYVSKKAFMESISNFIQI